jgi:hypothetical protein
MRQHTPTKPIRFHPCLNDAFDAWASACGYDPDALKRASEHAVCTRHHEAVIERESDTRRKNQPAVFRLSLGAIRVYYTVERLAVVIRGYGWEIDGEPLDDFDGGGFYADASWSLR